MHPSPDFLGTPELNYEQWRDALRPNWGLYTPDDPLLVGCALGASADLTHRILATILAAASGRNGIFASTVLTITMPYFRLPDDQRSFRMNRL